MGYMQDKAEQLRQKKIQRLRTAFMLGAEWATQKYLPIAPEGFYMDAIEASRKTFDDDASFEDLAKRTR